MAAVPVTGNLKDLAGVSLGDRIPELVFELDEDLVILGSSTLIPAEPVKVTPAANGTFTVNLQESLGTNPYSPYKLTINWSSNGLSRTVTPSWRIVVPPGGGAIGDMLAIVTPSQIITRGVPGDASPYSIVQALAASSGQALIVNPTSNSAPRAPTPAWTAYYGAGGGGFLTFVEDVDTPSKAGYVRMTWNNDATAASANLKLPLGVATPGRMWAGIVSVRSSVATVMGATIYFYDAGGAQIGATYYNRLIRVPAGMTAWTDLEVNGVRAPAGTATVRIGAAMNSTLSTVPLAGHIVEVSAGMPMESNTVHKWHDGDSLNAYWTGLENLSPSVKVDTELEFAAPFTNAPAAAGVRAGRYSTAYRLYLPEGADIGPMRRRIAGALAGKYTYRAAGMGHSMIAGQGGSPGVIDDMRLLQLRAAQAGQSTPGMVTAWNNTTPDARITKDAEWYITGGPRSNMQLHLSCATAGKSFTVAFDHAATVVDIYTFGNGSAVSYSIDNGTPVTITPSGASAIQVTTVTGLANTTHTVKITSLSATTAYILGISLRNATGLEIGNFGYSGSIANDWIPTGSGTGASFYNGYSDIVHGWKADGVIIQLGANEIIWSTGSASLVTNLGLILANLRTYGKDVLLVVDPPVYSDTRTTWFSDFYPKLYDVADAYQVPLLDLSAHWINRGIGSARGLYFDQWHPNPEGYFDLHSVFAKALLP
ncbi:SGNH/GDSL hydrolase family protein [Arthrobacter sp. UYCu712]|uniref:SGNH/GDSL hydrolase family protein n=1 Tax=Arthrobacter sp. UYCu712 TaxID=3156340 RepID=UPI003392E21F